MFLDVNALTTTKSSASNIIPLYPFHSVNMAVLFVYSDDFKRQKCKVVLTRAGGYVLLLLTTSILFATATLSYLRKKNKLRRAGFIPSFIDVYISFFGGGNLRVKHNFERLLFGILLIGFLFLTTFWLDVVLFPSFLIRDNSIETFKDLAKINPPIFSSFVFKEHEKSIEIMLKYLLFSIFYFDF